VFSLCFVIVTFITFIIDPIHCENEMAVKTLVQPVDSPWEEERR